MSELATQCLESLLVLPFQILLPRLLLLLSFLLLPHLFFVSRREIFSERFRLLQLSVDLHTRNTALGWRRAFAMDMGVDRVAAPCSSR